MLCSVPLCDAMLCVAMLCDATLHYATSRHAMTYYALRRSSTPCYAVLCHASRTFLLLLFLLRLQALEGRGDDDDDEEDASAPHGPSGTVKSASEQSLGHGGAETAPSFARSRLQALLGGRAPPAVPLLLPPAEPRPGATSHPGRGWEPERGARTVEDEERAVWGGILEAPWAVLRHSYRADQSCPPCRPAADLLAGTRTENGGGRGARGPAGPAARRSPGPRRSRSPRPPARSSWRGGGRLGGEARLGAGPPRARQLGAQI